MDRIDPLFYARSNRIDLKDETRIKATSEEASEWAAAQQDPNGGYNFQLEDDSSINYFIKRRLRISFLIFSIWLWR
jgi:hypothetical protein